jgi:hypothetical protein
VNKIILSYGWETWTLDYKLKKKLLSTKMDFCRTTARTSRLLKVRNKVIREKMGVTKQFWKEWKIIC